MQEAVRVRRLPDLVWVAVRPDFKQLIELATVLVHIAVAEFVAELVSRVLPLGQLVCS